MRSLQRMYDVIVMDTAHGHQEKMIGALATARDVREIQLAKGAILTAAQLAQAARLDMLHVPFQGGGPALTRALEARLRRTALPG